MKPFINTLLVLGLFFAAGCKHEQLELVGPQIPDELAKEIIPDEYILYLKPEFIMPGLDRLGLTTVSDRLEKIKLMLGYKDAIESQVYAWLEDQGVKKEQIKAVLTGLRAGAVIHVDAATFSRLEKAPEVEQIDFNFKIYQERTIVEPESKAAQSSSGQQTTCAITNANGWGTPNQTYCIWIMDTGIDTKHPDLNVLLKYRGYKIWGDFTDTNLTGGGPPSPEDPEGHGTAVAGFAAAKNNNIGVVGVAAGAPVVPIKVYPWNLSEGLYSSGSAVIGRALDHIAIYAIPGDVCNMSFVLGQYIPRYHNGIKTRIINLANYGVRFTIGAGNGASFVNTFPQNINHPNVFTVAGMNCNKTWWSGSSFGRPPVDWVATASNIRTTVPLYYGGYATVIPGTSFAAPIVAGIVHLRQGPPHVGGYVNRNSTDTGYKIAWR